MFDEEPIPRVGTNRVRVEDLWDPDMPYNYALKRATHESTEYVAIDKKRHAKIAIVTSSSSASPPPLPLPVNIPLKGAENGTDP